MKFIDCFDVKEKCKVSINIDDIVALRDDSIYVEDTDGSVHISDDGYKTKIIIKCGWGCTSLPFIRVDGSIGEIKDKIFKAGK